uniref:F-box domain-containing protein n=1 Tax=Leersia perrieri TaxID=77586 RepID=A0A0D9VG84_9ORYZ
MCVGGKGFYLINKETSDSTRKNRSKVSQYRMAFDTPRITKTETSKLKNLISASFKPLSLTIPIGDGFHELFPVNLCAGMQLKPPTRAKFSQGFMPTGECDQYCALIPGLPEDLAKICLALVPRSHFPVMGSVSKRWMSFLESKELIAVRKEVGKLEEWVYVLTADAGLKGSHWEVLGSSGHKHSPLPPMPGPTKAGFGVVVLDGKLFVIAGYDADHGKECVSDEVYRYDSCLNRWVELSKMNVARCDFACAEVNGMIYVAGGFGPNGDSLSSVEVYDPEQNKWTLIESLRRPRWGCFACSFEGKLYVMGGRSRFTIGNSRFVDVYNPNNHAWGEVKNGCVMVTAHAVLGEKLFCIEWKNQRSLAVFNPADNSWQKVPVPLTGSSSTRFCFGIHDGKLLLFPLDEEPGYKTLMYDPVAPTGSEWCTSELKPSGLCLCSVTIRA